MIKITKAQNEALEIFFDHQIGLRTQLGCISKMHGKWQGAYKPLNDLPFEDFAELLVMEQYEVQRTIEDVIDDHLDEASRRYRDNAERAIYDLKLELKQEGLI